MSDAFFDPSEALGTAKWRNTALDLQRVVNPRIDGVEVTQAIQYYKAAAHLQDPKDRGADNSLQLVAGKAAWVRVYVRSGLLFPMSEVSGTLKLERRDRGVWGFVTTVNPEPPGKVTARRTFDDYNEERRSTTWTLNFVIPAKQFEGVMRLGLSLTGSSGDEVDVRSITVNAALRQTLRVRAFLISYEGRERSPDRWNPSPRRIQLAAPTLADLQSTARLALRAWPVQSTGLFKIAGRTKYTRPLDDSVTRAGGCSPNWVHLLSKLAILRVADNNRPDVLYCGLLPETTPREQGGCTHQGVSALLSQGETTFMHEHGHQLGFDHAPCGVTGLLDPNFPQYTPYPGASIGEYGLNINNGLVENPRFERDFMSYCGVGWTSPYQHKRLIEHPRLDPRWALFDREWWRDYPRASPDAGGQPLPDPPLIRPAANHLRRYPVIVITGVVRSPTEVEVASVARVEAAGLPPGIETRYDVMLHDEGGKELARGAVCRFTTQGCRGCEGDSDRDPSTSPYSFQSFVPDIALGARLSIQDPQEGREIWQRSAPDAPPSISSFGASVSKDGDLDVTWKPTVSTDEAEAWLQWSGDEGETWNGLTIGLERSPTRLGLAGLPNGPVLIRLLLHDGFSTAVSEPALVDVPPRSPEASILHPAEGQVLPAGRTLHLWAAAAEPDGEPLEDEACRWLLNGKDVGSGTEVWLETPGAGEHRVTLIATGGGGEVEHSATFTTVAIPDDNEPGEPQPAPGSSSD